MLAGLFLFFGKLIGKLLPKPRTLAREGERRKRFLANQLGISPAEVDINKKIRGCGECKG